MTTKLIKIKIIKKTLLIFSIIFSLGIMISIPQSSAQLFPYYPYPPTFFNPIYYPGYFPIGGTGFIDPSIYFYPTRNAALVTSTLLASLLTTPTTPTTTTLLGLATAITLASTGSSISTSTLALLASTPLPTLSTFPTFPTTTPTIGTTTLLLLGGGGVSTTTLLLLGI